MQRWQAMPTIRHCLKKGAKSVVLWALLRLLFGIAKLFSLYSLSVQCAELLRFTPGQTRWESRRVLLICFCLRTPAEPWHCQEVLLGACCQSCGEEQLSCFVWYFVDHAQLLVQLYNLVEQLGKTHKRGWPQAIFASQLGSILQKRICLPQGQQAWSQRVEARNSINHRNVAILRHLPTSKNMPEETCLGTILGGPVTGRKLRVLF